MKDKNIKIVIAIIIISIIIIFILACVLINLLKNNKESLVDNKNEYSDNKLENIFSKMSNTTFDIIKDQIRTKDSGVEPYGIFAITFSYDSERPELGFKSPSGKLYYTDCKNDIEKENYKFSVSVGDFWASVALPAEEGTWYLYYDKKSNDSIDYSIIDGTNENKEESDFIDEQKFETEDIEYYEKYGNFRRQFSLNIPESYSFDNDMHKFITNDIANIINQGEDVEFTGYSPKGSQVSIYIKIVKADSSEDITNKALNVAYKSRDKWNSIYKN